MQILKGTVIEIYRYLFGQFRDATTFALQHHIQSRRIGNINAVDPHGGSQCSELLPLPYLY